jgi:Winged helix-turn helix
VTWRRAQMVLGSAQGMDVAAIATVSFTSPGRVRDVLHNFSADGFDSLRPKYAGGGRPPKFDADQREQVKTVALGRPVTTGCRSRHGACPSWPTICHGVSFPARQDLVQHTKTAPSVSAKTRGRAVA